MIEPIRLKVTDISMVVGMRGTGKTVLAKHLTKQYIEKGIKVMIYDPNNEYGDLEEKHASFIVERYVPKETLSMEEFNNFVIKAWDRYIVVLLEEVDLYAPTHQISKPFQRLISLGRHRHIGIIAVTRRIAEVHKLLCSQARNWFIFRTILPNDIDYMRKFVGDVVKNAPNLKDYHFIYWSHGKAVMYNPIEVGFNARG
jgi:DNA helicase HerA-like ATPase